MPVPPDDRPEPDRPHEPHGLVEEIREEIEHAVEHVPKPVRWTVGKLVWLAVLSLVALVAIVVATLVLYYSNHTELVAKELTLFLNHTLATRSDLALDVRDIRGNPFGSVRLVGARVRFADRKAPPLLEAPAIDVSYSPWSFLGRGERGIDIVVQSPVLRLARDARGALRLPEWKTEKEAGGEAAPYNVHLRLRNGRLEGPEPLGTITGLNLDALASTGRESRAQLRSLSWDSGPYGSKRLSLAGEISAGDSVRFRIVRLTTADLELTARGAWEKGAPERRVHVEVARLTWSWLARVTDNRSFDVPGEGRVVVDARGDSAWSGSFVSSLTWRDLAFAGDGRFRWGHGRLVIEPLNARSAAGDLTGRVAWSHLGWEVGGAVLRGDPARWGAIGIPGWPTGAVNGSFRYAVDTRGRSSSRLEATLAESELAGWRADQGTVTVITPAAGADSFRVRVERRGGLFTLDAATRLGGWAGAYVVERFPLDEWPDGRASGIRGTLEHGAGTVQDQDGRLLVTGALEGLGTDWFGASFGRWRIDGLEGALLPKPDLAGSARLGQVFYLGLHFDSTQAGVHVGDQTLAFTGLAARAGDTLVTAAGHADWSGSSWRLALDPAEMASRHFDWVATAPIELHGDAQGVTFDRLEARDSTATVTVEGRWAVPGGSYDWRGKARGLLLAHLGMPEDWALQGRADVDFAVRGASGDPRWTFEAQASQPGSKGHGADSIAVALDGGPHALDVRRLTARLGTGAATASGLIERTTRPWPDSLNAESVARWIATAARWEGRIAASDLPLSRLERIAPAARGWSGGASGTLEIRGSPAHPELRFEGEARPLSWRNVLVESLGLTGTYANDRLDVSELRMTRGSVVSIARGHLGLALAFGTSPRLLDQPMSWRIDMPQGDLALLPLFVPQVGSAAGKMELEANVAGTPKHPDLDGTLRIQGGSVRLAGRDEVLEDVYASMRLDESHVTLDTLVARQGERGRLRGNGQIELTGMVPRKYHFDLTLRDFTASEPGVYAIQFDGKFVVVDGPRVNGQWLPTVTGDVDIHRAVILFDFANQSETQQLASTVQPLYWTYRIQASAKNNVFWRPPDADIELNADLSLEQTPKELMIYGEMHALRGVYYFLDNRFTVNQVDLTFDNVVGLNPQIDAEAVTRVVPAGPSEVGATAGGAGGEVEKPHDVTVKISGRANEPNVTFASSPDDWDEPRILQELTVGRFLGTNNARSFGDPLDNYVTRALNRTLSAEMSRAFRGYITDWEINRERGGLIQGSGDVVLGVGSQVTSNLLLRYRQRLPGLGRTDPLNTFERDIEAEYRLNRLFYVTSELTQKRNLTGNVTGPSVGSPGTELEFAL